MTEMRERVARAICKAESMTGDDTDWRTYEDTARAAIETMREPTDKMCEAGDDGYYGMSGEEVWQAMIDEALRDG